jgi:hypothetical protein
MSDTLCPEPLPDETIFSWLCRYHLLAAHHSFRHFTLPMLGVNASRPANEFPSCLLSLSKLSGIELDALVKQMTSVNYYQPFILPNIYRELLQALRDGNTYGLQSQLGMVANRITPGMFLKYCPVCAEYDRRQFGVAYWHKIHQLVGITTCVYHRCHLVEVKKTSIKILLPTEFHHVERSGKEEFELSKLISDEFFDELGSISKKLTYQAYEQRLRLMGFYTKTGRIRQKAFKSYLLGKFMKLEHLSPYFDYLIELTETNRYPQCLFYRSDCIHHPIKHFFLIYALFESWADFKDSLNVKKQTTEIYLLKKIDIKQDDNFWKRAFKMLRNGSSLRKVAKKIGTTVSTLKIKAVLNHVVIDRRPSKIKPDVERAIWRKLFMGIKTQHIALEFNLSVGAIEKVLTQYKGLKQHRKHIWYVDGFHKHKLCISAFLLANPKATRNQVRKEVRASYYWLYKHEKEWLYDELPERVIARYWPRRVDK